MTSNANDNSPVHPHSESLLQAYIALVDREESTHLTPAAADLTFRAAVQLRSECIANCVKDAGHMFGLSLRRFVRGLRPSAPVPAPAR